MELLAIIGLVVGVGYGVDNDWKVAKEYKTLQECKEAHPHTPNTMTSWSYNKCNLGAFYVKNNT